jgi:hypothetical protein
MTQDEREQKALEAAWNVYERAYDINDISMAGVESFAHAYHAAMTEGGVWVSRKDAAFIADSLETTAPLIAKVGTPEGFTAKERSLSIAARIRAKLEGNHDT